MTKIRATKDSPLAKQGEVFELSVHDKSVNILGVNWSYSHLTEWIEDGWFVIVEEKETLSRKINSYSGSHFLTSTERICTIAREHAIEIVKEAAAESCEAYYRNGIRLVKVDYIIQKLEEKMR